MGELSAFGYVSLSMVMGVVSVMTTVVMGYIAIKNHKEGTSEFIPWAVLFANWIIISLLLYVV